MNKAIAFVFALTILQNWQLSQGFKFAGRGPYDITFASNGIIIRFPAGVMPNYTFGNAGNLTTVMLRDYLRRLDNKNIDRKLNKLIGFAVSIPTILIHNKYNIYII